MYTHNIPGVVEFPFAETIPHLIFHQEHFQQTLRRSRLITAILKSMVDSAYIFLCHPHPRLIVRRRSWIDPSQRAIVGSWVSVAGPASRFANVAMAQEISIISRLDDWGLKSGCHLKTDGVYFVLHEQWLWRLFATYTNHIQTKAHYSVCC